MSRQPLIVTLALLGSTVFGALVPAVSGASNAPAVPSAAGAKVQVRHTQLGELLVTGRGLTLYTFTRDGHNRDRCAQISGCRGVWLLDTTHGQPTAGPGARRSLLGTIRVGGATQVTYAGRPLYTYVADSGPGETGYVGASQFGGRWFGIRASGRQAG